MLGLALRRVGAWGRVSSWLCAGPLSIQLSELAGPPFLQGLVALRASLGLAWFTWWLGGDTGVSCSWHTPAGTWVCGGQHTRGPGSRSAHRASKQWSRKSRGKEGVLYTGLGWHAGLRGLQL